MSRPLTGPSWAEYARPSMEPLSPLLFIELLAVGALVGLVAGMVGIGGGILFIPALLLLLPNDLVAADQRLLLIFGTTLAASWLTAAASSAIHRRPFPGVGRDAVALGAAAVAGAQIGTATAAGLSPALLESTLAVILLITAPLLLFAAEPTAEDDRSGASANLGALIIIGLGVGAISTTVGLGGAILTTPILVLGLHVPSRKALALSTTMMILTAASGTLGYVIHGLSVDGLPPLSLGYVNLPIAATIAAASIPLALLGAKLSLKTDPRIIRGLLGAALAVVAVTLLLS